MADLDKITHLTGLMFTSDQINGTDNQNATFTVANVTTTQRDLLENVTPYTVGGNTNVRVKNGTMIYNITTQRLEVFIMGEWKTISLA